MNYCIDPNADEPIMILNRTIGTDFGEIDGALFQEELMTLDTMGKKRIQVWINSPGGEVINGMNIFNAIQKSNTPVDTYNVGIAASIAGCIFMAGRNRYMSDYGRLMMHPVQGTSDSKAYDAFMGQVTAMLQSKSKCTEDEVTRMVTATSWLTASQCLDKGFCTHIENTRLNNSKYAKLDATALWEVTNKLLLTQTPKKMEKVTNLLKLTADANEDSIVSAINLLTDAKNKAETNIVTLTASLKEAQDKVTTIEAELAVANEATAASLKEVATNNATALVKTFTNRIGTDEKVLAVWTDMAVNDLEKTKTLLEAIPLNVIAPKLAPITDVDGIAGGSAQAEMLKIQNRLKTEKK